MSPRTSEPKRKKPESPSGWLGFGPVNAGLFGLGLVMIAAGYVLLDRGSVSAAPILLVLGYAVLVPVALLFGLRRPR